MLIRARPAFAFFRRRKWARGAGAGFAWFLALAALAAAAPPAHFYLEFDIANERGGPLIALFDHGDGMWGDHGASVDVPASATPQTVRLHVPARPPVRELRLDPSPGDGSVLVTGIRLLNDRGERLVTIDPRRLRPMHQIQSIVPEAGGVRIQPLPKADDPMVRMDLAPMQQAMHAAMERVTVGRGTVVLLALLLGGLMLVAVGAAVRAHGQAGAWVGGTAVFCVVWGARLFWLNRYARSVPFWDEWEGDALYILIPFNGGFLDWGALFMPQWEHRILLTRVITLFGTVLNGEWDPRVAMTVSAAIFAATVGLLGTVLLAPRRWLGAAATLLLAGGASLPFDFNNLLWGGQTQMYALVLMAIGILSLAAAPAPTPAIKVAALAGSLVSLITMGAGPVAPGLATGICLVRAWFEKEQRRGWLGLAAIFFVVALVGVFMHQSSRAHVPLYATTAAQFWKCFLGVLAWPLPPRIGWAVLLWVPWIVNGVLVFRRRGGSSLEWLALGLGTWGLVNAVALGYARQYEGPPFDSRFFTPLAIGALGSFCSSVALGQRASRWALRTLPLIAWGAVAAGLLSLGVKGVAGARESGESRAEIDHRIRIFLSTGNRTPLMEKPPHHTANDIVHRLELPLLQSLLPAPYRRAIAIKTGRTPAARIEAGPVTLTVRTLMKCGWAIAALGCLGFAWHVRRVARRGGWS